MLKTTVIGNLGADAIIREWNGKQAISFSVAHNEKYKDSKGVQHDKTTWVNCTLWRNSDTKLVQYLRKGQLVYLEGLPDVKVYQNKAGQFVPDFSLNITNLQLMGGKSSNEQEQEEPAEEPATADASASPTPQPQEEKVPWEN